MYKYDLSANWELQSKETFKLRGEHKKILIDDDWCRKKKILDEASRVSECVDELTSIEKDKPCIASRGRISRFYTVKYVVEH